MKELFKIVIADDGAIETSSCAATKDDYLALCEALSSTLDDLLGKTQDGAPTENGHPGLAIVDAVAVVTSKNDRLLDLIGEKLQLIREIKKSKRDGNAFPKPLVIPLQIKKSGPKN